MDKLDLIFVLDSSNSLQPNDKKEMKDFMKKLIENLGVADNKTHVGVMTFDDSPNLVFHLGTHKTQSSVIAAIDKMKFGYGATDTGKALKYLKEEMFTKPNGDRPHVPNVAVVLTDGFSKDAYATQYYANESKKLGISIFAVGVGPSVDPGELKSLSSSPADQYAFIIHSFSDLDKVGDQLVNTTCSVRLPNTSITAVSTAKPGCYDRKDCMVYGEDVCTDYAGWSSYHCPLWCGFCNGTTSQPPCLDILPNCVEYGGDICTRPDLRIWALRHCRAYCGFSPCIGTPTRATTTPKPTTPRVCQDRVNCEHYGGHSICHDEKYKGWAKDNCYSYCGYCVEYAIIPPTTIGNLHCPGWKIPSECKMTYGDATCCPMPKCPTPGYNLTVTKPHL
ncbi:uncharacterized protein LOC135475797 [Liolophura sinensis]|uniref:uncharacterized protein LOC135475797 n=1 Tax=Liolophura sinensis TaxID=3198878 RepID=UPI0031595C3E